MIWNNSNLIEHIPIYCNFTAIQACSYRSVYNAKLLADPGSKIIERNVAKKSQYFENMPI